MLESLQIDRSYESLQFDYSTSEERLRQPSRKRAESQKVRQKVASMMDGTHCDDEIACAFDRSFEELLELNAGTKIVSVYATAAIN